MKAHWIQGDFEDMRLGRLHFARKMWSFYHGIDRGEARLALRGAMKEYHGHTQGAEVPR